MPAESFRHESFQLQLVGSRHLLLQLWWLNISRTTFLNVGIFFFQEFFDALRQLAKFNLKQICCLSEYVVPAFPYVVLGRFRNGEKEAITDESLYNNATAFILTFISNKDKLGPAKERENGKELWFESD